MATDDEYNITADEAFHFLHDVLQMECTETWINANKVFFLGEFIKGMHYHIPFQTISGIAIPDGKRQLPSAADIKTDIFSKLGGICYQINLFCWMLLRALGFDTRLLTSDVFGQKDYHIGVIINGLTGNGSKHLLEVGSSYPSRRLIPLDFENCSPEYFDSYMKYRFIRRGEGTVIFQHKVNTVSSLARKHPEYIEGEWFSFIFYNTERYVSVSHFNTAMTSIMTVVNEDDFALTSLRCTAYPNGRLVCIKDSKLMLEDEGQEVQYSHFRSRDEFLEAFQRYFPQFTQSMIRAAMKNIQFKLL
ncbi:uncharacterized protein LOC121427740 [Lytechinus variegatus]|uniref:uncharacterized protein LOC121427740 n=1 Tax=Lytechinus variegatus TaxID=7654 RepID=UPI001BB1256D|nr:uncharacterized protein LOC121427740 [Lytechinus variegatus]XP_041480216.1 uncharacterized protein LOC121427740 [Lytechinus variegatus]